MPDDPFQCPRCSHPHPVGPPPAVPTQLWLTHAAVARLDAAQGTRVAAERSRQAARAVLENVRDRPQDAALRASVERLIAGAMPD